MQISKSRGTMMITMVVCLLAYATASPETRTRKLGADSSFKAHLRELREDIETNGNEANQLVQNFATAALIEQGTKDLIRSLADLEESTIRRSLATPAYPATYGGSGTGFIPQQPGTDGSIISQTPLSFEMVINMQYTSIANTLAVFSADTQSAIANGLSISSSRVAITRIAPANNGHVIIDFKILIDSSTSAADSTAIVSQLTSTPANVVGSTYLVTKYQANGITVSQVGDNVVIIGGSGMPPPPPPPPMGSSLLSVSVKTCLFTALAAVLLLSF